MSREKGDKITHKPLWVKTTLLLAALLCLVQLAGIFIWNNRGQKNSPQAGTPNSTDRITGYFFYSGYCESCAGDTEKFLSILQEKLPLTERDRYPNNIAILNISNAGDRSIFERVTDEMGIDRDTLSVPFLILGGGVFQGFESISENIREAYYAAAENLGLK